ncbi:argininosuccinate lyase [Desulfovibrio sp. OttesenSCG-928-I05]|nr:argininosuccinate lyase [Desulfovibrio sp. OttesenSCG-928-I05]
MSKQQTWGGRFSEGPAALVRVYTESVSYDRALYAQDIAGSKAHAAMLAGIGILTEKEALAIREGLDSIQREIENGDFVWREELEDVHMNIESRLTELIGDAGKKLHTGRSRNDQVALDFRLFVSDRLRAWQELARDTAAALLEQAEKHSATLLPGCTHMQPAQPVALSQHLLAYVWMLKRDCERMADADKRARISPLGAAALAGTTYPLNPAAVAAELGMNGIFANSMDAVSDRDFAAEALFCASLVMAHLSRLCEDIIIWANPAFGFVRVSDAYSTGSSIMPQKRNPDVAELMRGKTGRVYGALTSLLTLIKGLPMTYNRDLQEDKERFIDTDRTLSLSLEAMAGMVRELTFDAGRMQAALRKGFLNATELADYLVSKGVPFREAHHITGSAVAYAEAHDKNLEDLTLQELQQQSPLIDEQVYKALDPAVAVARRNTPGGTGPDAVKAQMVAVREWLGMK